MRPLLGAINSLQIAADVLLAADAREHLART